MMRVDMNRARRPCDICKDCTRRKPGCRRGCEEYAIEVIMDVVTGGRKKAMERSQLGIDLHCLGVDRRRRALRAKAAQWKKENRR